MFLYFLQLAVSRIFHRKKNSILSFLVFLTSFSFIIVALSIVGSISKTNTEYRLNTYGEWSFAILPADGLETMIENHEQIEEVGKAVCYGMLQTARGPIGIGTIDDNFLHLGRIALEDGHFPQTEKEIAMEASTLSALGYDYTLGQEITVYLEQGSQGQSVGTAEKLLPPVAETFTLCGVIQEFSSLWCAGGRNEQQILVSAFITPETAKSIAESAGFDPSLQLFLDVLEENRENIKNRLMSDPPLVLNTFENVTAYPNLKQTATSDSLYIYLIATVSLAAVFSVFFLQMRDSYYSYAVCRSIGMTKKQLALLLALETLILVLPAVILGTLLGGALIFLALRLLMYSGSAPIQVDIPVGTLAVVILLWVVCAIICRLVLFFATSRAQLTGAFQLSHVRSVKVHRIAKCAIFVLTALFGTTLLFTGLGSLEPLHTIHYYSISPAYTIWAGGGAFVPKGKTDLIKQIPGISFVDGFVESPVAISFPGIYEISAWLYCLDGSGWDETFNFDGDWEAFHNGDVVLLTFRENRLPDILPSDGNVTLHFLSDEFLDKTSPGIYLQQYENENLTLRFQSDEGCITEKTTPVSIRMISDSVHNRLLAYIWGPYSIICSEKFLEDALTHMETGQQWDGYVAGNEFGYTRVYVGADLNSGYLSTDIMVAEFCSENDFILDNRRQEFLSRQQEGLQELIFLLSTGGCISIISILLLCNILQLEAVQEKKAFAILRMIGMSKRKMRSRILCQSAGTCLFATVLGLLFYVCYTALCIIFSGEDVALFLTRPDVAWNLVTLPQLILFLSICVIVPLACFLIAKLRAMKKEDDPQ